MVDAHVSGACVERHAGSRPVVGTIIAEIAQLGEHNLAKVRVASSSLVFRSCTYCRSESRRVWYPCSSRWSPHD